MKKEFSNLPIYKELNEEYLLKKHIVKNFPNNFGIVKDEKEIEYATTSGTTSDRMEIVRKLNWWADEYVRTYSNDEKLKKYLDDNLHKVIFTTAQCSNLVCFLEKPPMDKRIINNTLYVNNTFNPWDWTKEDIKQIIYEINYFKPYYLDAYPVYLAVFLYLKDKYNIKEELFKPEIITLSYEFVQENLRKYIKKEIDTDIRNLYGTTEFGYALLENKDGKMKLCKDLLDAELLSVSEENNIYTLIISSVKNEYMPLINYRVGDMVIASKEEAENFKKEGIVSKMAGREKDMLNGNVSYSVLDEIVSEALYNILFYQFYFISDSMCYFRYITHDGEKLPETIVEDIKNKIKDIGLNMKIKFDLVEEIAPEKSGKFAIVKKTMK